MNSAEPHFLPLAGNKWRMSQPGHCWLGHEQLAHTDIAGGHVGR